MPLAAKSTSSAGPPPTVKPRDVNSLLRHQPAADIDNEQNDVMATSSNFFSLDRVDTQPPAHTATGRLLLPNPVNSFYNDASSGNNNRHEMLPSAEDVSESVDRVATSSHNDDEGEVIDHN